MELTPLQQLIEDLENLISINNFQSWEKLKSKYLPLEKKAIVDAHIVGQKFASDNNNPDSEEYFSNTYKQ